MLDLQAQIDALRERVEMLETQQYQVLPLPRMGNKSQFKACEDCGAHMTVDWPCYDTVCHWTCPKCGRRA